jgi:hypothetical protein
MEKRVVLVSAAAVLGLTAVVMGVVASKRSKASYTLHPPYPPSSLLFESEHCSGLTACTCFDFDPSIYRPRRVS